MNCIWKIKQSSFDLIFSRQKTVPFPLVWFYITQLATERLLRSFLCSFIPAFICLFIHSLNHSLIHSFTTFFYSFSHSLTHSFIHYIFRSHFHSSAYLTVCELNQTFVRAFVRSFIHSFTSSFSWLDGLLQFDRRNLDGQNVFDFFIFLIDLVFFFLIFRQKSFVEWIPCADKIQPRFVVHVRFHSTRRRFSWVNGH